MWSIIASLSIAAVVYGFVAIAVDPVAGVVPAVFAFGIAAFLLLRRVAARLQLALAPIEGLLRAGKVDEADKLLEGTGKALGPWMPLLPGQIASQRGMLDYARQRYDAALPRLRQGRWRNWYAMACIACIHWRAGDKEGAFKELEAATKAGSREPLAWSLRAVLLHKAERDDEALKVLGEGLTSLPDHPQLVDLKATIANKKKVETVRLGQGWYQFFPEELRQQTRPVGGYQPFGVGFRGPATSKRGRRG